MFLLVDNYDSFTYNLVQAFQVMGESPVVVKNDDPELAAMADKAELSRVCLSPGPGHPRSSGFCFEFLKRLDRANPQVPVLGVCLGHQILGAFAGGEIYVSDKTMHGKTSDVSHDGRGLFQDLPEKFSAARYNSLLVKAPANGEAGFRVTAETGDDEVMALSYKDRPWVGVQFHPESVLTPQGPKILANFLSFSTDRSAKSAAVAAVAGPEYGFEKTPHPLPVVMEAIASGRDLSPDMAARLFSRLMDGELSPSQAGSLLMGLRAKGETPVEISAAAEAVLERAVALPPLEGPVLDIVGTGGDGRNSFNCSTAAALVMAGLGYKVVKHGNRSISSRCGSADVLELLGLDLDTPPETVPVQLQERNFAFLFAPSYHPAFRHVMPVRKELGIRTLFNILGPLVNPARPEHSFLGAPNPEALSLMAEALARREAGLSAVVHGAGGYDELTTLGPSQTFLVYDGRTEEMIIDPADFGFEPCDPQSLCINGPADGAAVLRELLRGNGSKPMRDMLALNVAMAVYIMTGAVSMAACVKEARRAVADGVGGGVLG